MLEILVLYAPKNADMWAEPSDLYEKTVPQLVHSTDRFGQCLVWQG